MPGEGDDLLLYLPCQGLGHSIHGLGLGCRGVEIKTAQSSNGLGAITLDHENTHFSKVRGRLTSRFVVKGCPAARTSLRDERGATRLKEPSGNRHCPH